MSHVVDLRDYIRPDIHVRFLPVCGVHRASRLLGYDQATGQTVGSGLVSPHKRSIQEVLSLDFSQPQKLTDEELEVIVETAEEVCSSFSFLFFFLFGWVEVHGTGELWARVCSLGSLSFLPHNQEFYQGGFHCIFPRADSRKYLQYFDASRYNNHLLVHWRESGCGLREAEVSWNNIHVAFCKSHYVSSD